MKKNLLLIINPCSGRKKKTLLYDYIKQVFRREKYTADVVYTERRGHASELAASAKNYDRVVCVGGDGTLSEVCNGIMAVSPPPEIAYIPAGTTNDFARNLNISRNCKRSARSAARGTALPLDLGIFQGDGKEKKYFSYVASFGLFTKVAYLTEQKKKNRFGSLAYVIEVIKNISDFRNFEPFKLKIEYDDVVLDQEYIFGAITNSNSLGGFIKLDKKSILISDGKFELFLVLNPKRILDYPAAVSQMIRKKYKPERIIFEHIKKVKLTSETPLDWTLDGEYAGSIKVTEISVAEKAINFVRNESDRG